MDSNLKKKIENILGEPIHTFELLKEQGCTSIVRKLVTANGKRYLLKSAHDEKYRSWLKNEANVLQTLASSGEKLPTPKYYGFIECEQDSHLIMSFEKGMTLTAALEINLSAIEKRSLIRSFGEFLHHFHERPPLRLFERDHDWLEQQLDIARKYVETNQVDGGSLELLEQLKANKPAPVQQTLIHGDCTTDNVLVIDGKVQLFIDVSDMAIGDPRYDESLAIRSFIDIPEYLDAFYEGYRRYRVSRKEFQYFDEGLYEFF